MPSTSTLLIAVLVTWVVEWSVCSSLLRRFSWDDGQSLLLINAFTNPLANAAFNLGEVPFLVVEAAVVLAEIPLLRLLVAKDWRTAFVVSVAVNSLSASLSFLL